MKRSYDYPCIIFSRSAFSLFWLIAFLYLIAAGNALADVRGTSAANRTVRAGSTVPNPGTQPQELGNITFPAPYNVFEFVVTCGACHGGTVDQNAAHFGNWAGSNMASAARDPVFRANQIIVNNQIKAATGKDGAGNMCFRCHSPNAWLSGRTDPAFNGSGDGSQMIQSVLASTDHEGISCEACHRATGNVTMKRIDLLPSDPAWNMMAGIDDWPHTGAPFPSGPLAGLPFGDATLQYNDGMTYGGKYAGSVSLSFSDLPIFGTYYTGQTYGIYPDGWLNALGQDISGQVVVNADDTTPVHFEAPIGPPLKGGVGPGYDYQAQAISIEHPTYKNDFIRSSEFCGSCHDLTVPVLNHGMPEQRTYTEWKFSAFGKFSSNGVATGPNSKRCQDCHMPTLKHEYSDTTRISMNPDPTLTGFFPYGKDRNPNGGTTFHKMAGANRDLPQMMKLLYPEVDLEVIGAPTGKDTRLFPGMMSDRSAAWNRTTRDTEVTLAEAAGVEILGITEVTPGNYEAQVKVTNNSGHRIPTGYPDGRRLWIAFSVRNGTTTLYESGYYDQACVELYNDSSKTAFARARGPVIDQAQNAVMVYEKRTGKGNGDGTYAMSVSLLNEQVVFDNRIPPKGYTRNDYFAAGTGFTTYSGANEAAVTPVDDPNRYPDGQNWDVVTYRFTAPQGLSATLTARAELYWQTHTREFMEFLKTSDTSSYAPEGPPDIFDPNYPLTPNYLIDKIGAANMTDLAGSPLNNNWGGIAYAAWKLTGKGEPMLVATADTSAVLPVAPTGLTATSPPYVDPTLGITIKDPFTLNVSWNRVADADGYLIWVRYGVDTGDPALPTATASWDKLAVVRQPPAGQTPSVIHEALNVAKTYQYKVQAFNGRGTGPESATVAAMTPIDLPLNPINTKVVPPVMPNAATLSWFDQADNEQGFVIQRQTRAANGTTAPFADYAVAPALPGFGGVTWTDTNVAQGATYNYQVAAYNASGRSTFDLPVTATIPYGITATAGADGTITPSGLIGVAPAHTQTFTISPNANFAVSDVLVDNVSVGAVTSYTFTNVTAPHTISAVFTLVGGITLTSSAGPNGTIAPLGNVTIPAGSSQTFTITPDPGYQVSYLLVDGAVLPAVTTYTFSIVSAGHTINAYFTPIVYSITATAGTGGRITPSGTVRVNGTANATFTIAPNNGFTLVDVVVDGVSQGAVTRYSFTNVLANHTINAIFGRTITASAGNNGTITPAGTIAVPYGANQTFTFTPNAGFQVDYLLIDGARRAAAPSYTFTSVTTSHTIQVFFKTATFTIVATNGTGGTIQPSGNISVGVGQSRSFAIRPNRGYNVADVIVDGVSQGPLATYTFTNVTANHTIRALFGRVINASAGPNGAISPAGNVVVPYGTNMTFTITPNAGFKVTSLVVDGKTLKPVNSYTFSNVTRTHTIRANFGLLP